MTVGFRSLMPAISEDLATHKMVLVSGPRQCGKTTLARRLVEQRGGAYFNWDVAAHRKLLRAGSLDVSLPLWVFDELHKFRGWRGWLKGQFDLHGREVSMLVTGSARLDVYSHGGDSLQGRYYAHRMHPLSLREVLGLAPVDDLDQLPQMSEPVPAAAQDRLLALLKFGGFPEPFFAASERRAARWRAAYGTRLVREDLRDLEAVRDLDRLELLFDRCPDLVGSVLSINSLREDLEVAFETVRNDLSIFERLFAVFRVPPWGAPRIKAVRKEQKLYLWDWARVEKPAARLENLVLSHLLKLVHHLEDSHGEKAELRFLRDTVGHELDAVVMRKGKPWLGIEVKQSDEPVDPNLQYFAARVKIPHLFQLSLNGTADRLTRLSTGQPVRQMPVSRFLAQLV